MTWSRGGDKRRAATFAPAAADNNGKYLAGGASVFSRLRKMALDRLVCVNINRINRDDGGGGDGHEGGSLTRFISNYVIVKHFSTRLTITHLIRLTD